MIRLQAAQNSILSFETRNPGTTTYHRSVAVDIKGQINVEAFQEALRQVSERHEVLRSSIAYQENGAYLKPTSDNATLPLQKLNASHLPPEAITEFAETLKKLKSSDLIEKPFDFKNGPLWRAGLVSFNKEHHQFMMLFHHLIIDEKSIGVIFNELSACYNAILQNKTPDLPPAPSLSEFKFDIPEDQVKKRMEYWQNNLKNLNAITLQTDRSHKKAERFQGKRIRFHLDKERITKLQERFSPHKLNTILLGIFNTLLYQLSNETDICTGITSSNRMHSGIASHVADNLVNGFFNSIPIRANVKDKLPFSELLTQLQSAVRDGLKHQLPIDDVYQKALSSETKSTLHTASPFNHLFVLNQKKPTLTLDNTTASYPVELDLGHTKFHYFSMNCDELDDGSYDCFFEYNTNLYHQNTIERFIKHFKQIIDTVIDRPEITIDAIPKVLEEEKILIEKFNHTNKPDDYRGFVHDILHETALKSPDKIASTFINHDLMKESLTYQQLDDNSSRLANFLAHKFLNDKNAPIGICLPRSNNLVMTSYAALKSGHPFVTLEASDNKFLSQKIKPANISAVIVDDTTQLFFENHDIETININDPELQIHLRAFSSEYKPHALNPEDLAYLMFTSGTTGVPKIVEITHDGFVNLLNSLHGEGRLKPDTKILSTALPTFDAFYYDVLVALASGGTLYLTPDKERLQPSLIEKITDHEKIDYAVYLPAHMETITPQNHLQHVISMGAPPNPQILDTWIQKGDHRIVENGYGNTEGTICNSEHVHHLGDDSHLIGHPIRNTQMYVLNPDTLSICPPGVSGEIYVAGRGIAKGYRNNPELTQENFITACFDPTTQRFNRCDSHTPNAIRLYRTRDVGHYQLTGPDDIEIKFTGRSDRQIKMFGVRVDLNEIENLLRQNSIIRNVIVLPNEDNTALTAYIESGSLDTTEERRKLITVEDMRKEVQKTLSDALVPTVARPQNIALLSKFPLNNNGKINTLTLRPIIVPRISIQPNSPLQEILKSIWADILSRPEAEIDISTSFEDLGGNSLLLARLETKLKTSLSLNLDNHFDGISILSDDMTILSLEKNLRPYVKLGNTLSNQIKFFTLPQQALYFRPFLFGNMTHIAYEPNFDPNSPQQSSNPESPMLD